LLFDGQSTTNAGNAREEGLKMFIAPAYAQAAGAPQDTLTTFILPMALIFVVFYFFMIRPQQQKQKQLKSMLDSLRRGDRVVTAGGLIGTISKVEGDEAQIDIAEGVRVRVVRSTIASVITKPEPVAAAKKDKESGEKKTPEPAEAGAGGGAVEKLRSFLRI
jgi:preprotein translocase subunit YajC